VPFLTISLGRAGGGPNMGEGGKLSNGTAG